MSKEYDLYYNEETGHYKEVEKDVKYFIKASKRGSILHYSKESLKGKVKARFWKKPMTKLAVLKKEGYIEASKEDLEVRGVITKDTAHSLGYALASQPQIQEYAKSKGYKPVEENTQSTTQLQKDEVKKD